MSLIARLLHGILLGRLYGTYPILYLIFPFLYAFSYLLYAPALQRKRDG